jgi:TRAP-type C4-dicarboxylate transport system permease small subunit
LEIWCHLAGTFFCAVLALYSSRLVWQSYTFNDVSQGNDATPLWIPQITMAVGAVVLLVAMADGLVLVLQGKDPEAAKDDMPKRIE